MIGKLTGTVDLIGDDSCILDVQGVGYLIYIPLSTLEKIRSTPTLSFYIETVVKEDSITLYGFITPLEQTWFKLLRTVQGVGARVALTLLSTFSPATLYDVIPSSGAIARERSEIDGSRVLLTLTRESELIAYERVRIQGGIIRYRTAHGWISEFQRDTKRHPIVSVLDL
ncbi:MAG: hypothetical protein B7Y79_00635, partial [Rhodospirillales bacterium 35-44-4]